jgi:2-methylcitrate dehydratase PrpD
MTVTEHTAHTGSPVTKTSALAAFGASITAAELPEQVVHRARRALVDWMAAALAGSAEPAAHRLRGVVSNLAEGGPCAVVGTSLRTSPPFAALANAYASHLLDYDDVYNPSATTIHLGSCVWPAVLAIGQARGLDGPALVSAYIAGFEVGARVACAAGREHYESGWHVTGTVGHVAAAAAAANALRLSPEATTHALGCSATQAAGVREVYGSDSKAMHPGKAAMDGVLAALLAENGFTATDTALEGRHGLLRAIAPNPRPDELVEGFGTHWHVLDNGHKLYPSASLTHAALDAALGLDTVDPSTVDFIEVRLAPFAADVTALGEPKTGTQAKFSTAHCVAVALIRRAARPAEFTDDVVADPAITALRAKIRVISDETVTKRGCRLRIRLRNGEEHSAEVTQNKGTPGAPLLDADLEEKLLIAGERIIGPHSSALLAKSCWALDKLPGVDTLMAGAVPGSGDR